MASLNNEQRTQVSRAIKEVGLELTDFVKLEGDEIFRLTYKDSKLYFEFQTYSNNYAAFKFQATAFSPNFNVYFHSYDRWFSDTLKHFESWLVDHVQAYVNDCAFTDPWEDIINYQNTYKDDEPFTKKEIVLMEQKLDTFSDYAKTLKLEPSEMQILIGEVKGLRADLGADKKKKWTRQVIGFLYDVAKVIVKDETARNAIYAFFKSILDYIPSLGSHSIK